jgi:hypothetical protein
MIFQSCDPALRLPRDRRAFSNPENVIETTECSCLAQAALRANV